MPPASLYAAQVIADGAAHYWRLGETFGPTIADSVGGDDGTAGGGITFNQPGPLADGSRAMVFDGTSGKIRVPAFPFPMPVTLEAWGTTSKNIVNPIFGNHVYGAIDDPLLMFGTADTHVAVLNTQGAQAEGTSFVADGAWHHLVALLDGATAAFYVDGVFDGTVPFAMPTPSNELAWISWLQTDPSRFWGGALAEVAIYPVLLNAAQIATHYALRTAPPVLGVLPADVIVRVPADDLVVEVPS